MRHVIQIMKDAVSRSQVEEFIWVDTKNMIADVLTKESAPTFLIKEALDNSMLDNGVFSNQTREQKEARED